MSGKKKSKLNENNENIEIKYNKYLTKGKIEKIKPSTAKEKIRSVRLYEKCFKYEDFNLFDEQHGMDFYDYLRQNDRLGVKARIKHLTNVKEFFEWYYKVFCRINTHKHPEIENALNTLEPTNEDIRLSRRITYVDYPTDEEIQKLMGLPIENIVDRRNRALLAYILLTGARIEAVATITIDLIDMDKQLVKQDPLEGTHTKLDKLIYTRFMILDPRYLDYLTEWIDYVKSKISDEKALLFPKVNNYASGIKITNEKVDSTRYNEIIKKMCDKAQIKDYHPHAFRHYVVNKGLQVAHTGKELKALSQNVGHWEIETILEQYANMPPEIYSNVIGNMFENKRPDLSGFATEDLLAELQARVYSDKF